ncbi:vegetative cell wall protein gp1 [Vitis vinifera]|uniref:vegetative cell wall protein gp1 n=1 Tax=Vitis vinifera TaxID=29760 RepID=UPI00053F3FC3|nr:vegetative cell wall protein gp1 [Vitis vinifera]|eukprot:XP_010650245.1 PREDICTED: vegetative cell wall protein gp1-like [Vitis vinifera]
MAKTRGGLSGSPSSPTPRPHRAAMGVAASPPVQAPAIPPSEGEAPSQRRYPTRRPPTDPMPPADQATSSVSRPPAKRTKFSGPGEPSHAPQPKPPTEDSRIPVGITPETVIRRPMITGPPIEAYFAPQGAPVVPAPPELPQDEQMPQAQQDEILTETTPPAPATHPSEHIPEPIHPISPITSDPPNNDDEDEIDDNLQHGGVHVDVDCESLDDPLRQLVIEGGVTTHSGKHIVIIVGIIEVRKNQD